MSSSEPYPPARHALRDLPFELEVLDATRQRAHLAADRWSVGALATVLDVLGGSLCAQVVAPDWMATSSLTVRLGALPVGQPAELDAQVLRAGRRSVVIECVMSVDGAEQGSAMLAFARLQRRDVNLDLSDRSVEPGARHAIEGEPGRGAGDFEPSVDQRVLDASRGATETRVGPYVRNSFGAVNGGVVAALAVGSARCLAGGSAVSGPPVEEVAVHHLGQGRVGPVRTSATWAAAGARPTARVELRDDGGADDGGGRLMAVAHVVLGSAAAQV